MDVGTPEQEAWVAVSKKSYTAASGELAARLPERRCRETPKDAKRETPP